MLINNSVMLNLPLGSVRSSGRIGYVTGVIINPNNLHIDALRCRIGNNKELLLSPIDIRNLSSRGVVINDHEILMDETDAIRLKPILKINYQLIGKSAYINKKKIGKVEGFAINIENLFIQKIYVTPGILARVNSDVLTFDRSLIEEVTDTKIIFNSDNKITESKKSMVENINPFRLPQTSVNASLTSEKE